MKLKRTRYYVPAHRKDLILDAINSEVDSIIFDMEDLVPQTEKEASREITRDALENLDFKDKDVMLRVNNYTTPLTALDLQLLTKRVSTVLYPKAESIADLQRLDQDLTEREKELGLEIGSIGIHPAIESALGLMNSYDIARSSKRITAISIGGGDFTKDIKGIKSGTGKELLYAKSHLIIVARAAAVMVLDTVYPRSDREGLVRETEESFILGFDGKGVISADQVPVIHEIYARMKGNK